MTAVDYLFDRLSTLYLFKDALLAKKALEEAKKNGKAADSGCSRNSSREV